MAREEVRTCQSLREELAEGWAAVWLGGVGAGCAGEVRPAAARALGDSARRLCLGFLDQVVTLPYPSSKCLLLTNLLCSGFMFSCGRKSIAGTGQWLLVPSRIAAHRRRGDDLIGGFGRRNGHAQFRAFFPPLWQHTSLLLQAFGPTGAGSTPEAVVEWSLLPSQTEWLSLILG